MTRHLTSIATLSDADITAVFTQADHFLMRNRTGDKQTQLLAGKEAVLLFFEPSTRTRVSFELAAGRMGMRSIAIGFSESSLMKGETLEDTATTLNAMHPDAVVMRHPESLAPERMAALMSCPVLNAGDGTNEHPSQALLDAFVLTRHLKTPRPVIAICGDIRHSRVARSNALLLPRLGMEVRLTCPPELAPDFPLPSGVTLHHEMEEGLAGVDAIMMLRIQKERMHEGRVPSNDAFLQHHGLTEARLALAKPGAKILHPGPVNRGVEIADSLVDHPERSLVLEQVEAGVAIRQALFGWALVR